MQVIVFDIEIYAYDFLVVFKDISTGQYTVVHNNNHAAKEFVTKDRIFGGFNSKFYDRWLLQAICTGADNTILKNLNDFIIAGNQGFEHYWINEHRFFFHVFDIRDDVQQGLSLKAIEGHFGMSIEETEIPFDLDRPLTEGELQSVIKYCKHDVDATEEMIRKRKNYLKCKQMLGSMRGIPPEKSLYQTNAKITAMYLGAHRREWNDGRTYEYSPNLNISIIPKGILNFFDTIHDLSMTDKELFKTYYKTDLGGCPTKYAWGGVHGSLLCYHEQSTETRIIQNRDVSSLYPSLIIKYNYLSRNAESPETFETTYTQRLKAKHDGDKEVANTLKLPLNVVSGATEQEYNDLYDPRQARSMRISGQLFLTELVLQLIGACKTFKLLNFNTDGLMYSVDKVELPIVDTLCSQWQQSTGFELETDDIDRVWIKDVNNLIFVMTDGKVKKVGGYLNYGISEKGAWSINNTNVIVKKAIADYFVKGTRVEETINGCNDILEFQIIAKAGSKYKEAYHLIDGEKVPVQKVNRVYASKDNRFGKLHKVKASDDSDAKIESLPEHCIIDNDNQLTIAVVDKEWYIELAKKRINDFLGIKPPKRNTRKLNSLRKEIMKLLEVDNVT